MHLDTVFTLCDRDLVNVYADGVEQIRPFSLRPGDRPAPWTSGWRRSPSWRSSGGAQAQEAARRHHRRRPFEQEREQWDDGNNVVALEPGVVAYNRNVRTTQLRKEGVEVITIAGSSSGGGEVAATA